MFAQDRDAVKYNSNKRFPNAICPDFVIITHWIGRRTRRNLLMVWRFKRRAATQPAVDKVDETIKMDRGELCGIQMLRALAAFASLDTTPWNNRTGRGIDLAPTADDVGRIRRRHLLCDQRLYNVVRKLPSKAPAHHGWQFPPQARDAHLTLLLGMLPGHDARSGCGLS